LKSENNSYFKRREYAACFDSRTVQREREGEGRRGGEGELSAPQADTYNRVGTYVLCCGQKAQVYFAYFILALFSLPLKPKTFQDFSSYQILRHMYKILNIDKNKN
jgi:hypothetical protein